MAKEAKPTNMRTVLYTARRIRVIITERFGNQGIRFE
jgi:hypothetical protein